MNGTIYKNLNNVGVGDGRGLGPPPGAQSFSTGARDRPRRPKAKRASVALCLVRGIGCTTTVQVD